MAAKASSAPVFQLKVTLLDIRPPVWRRLLVSSDVTLDRLHRMLQAAFDWEDYHLHVFTSGGVQYGVPSPEDWTPVRDERRVRLGRLLREPKDRIDYEYDFGDSWLHRVVLEKVLPAAGPGESVPCCLGGRRAGPPEDSGGPWGYQDLVHALGDPAHPRHAEYREWVGDDFDPEWFDREAVTIGLRIAAGGRSRRT